MTLTQYIAISTVLDYEIANNKENTVLPQVVHLLLDTDIPEEMYPQINHAVSALSAAVGEILAAGLVAIGGSLFSGMLEVSIVGAVLAAAWTGKIFPSNKKNTSISNNNCGLFGRIYGKQDRN